MIYDKKRNAHQVNQKKNYEHGDRVRSIIFGYYFGAAGTVVRKSRVQYLDRRGWDYDVLLDSGKTIHLHQNDMEYIGPQSYRGDDNGQD